MGPLGGHHPASLRHRHAHPRRARSRLDPRHQPGPPGTTTTSHHHNQLNQPPQNPGLDSGSGWSGAGPTVVGTGVLPLSSDDPGARVVRGSRALVTADKGNGPLRARSNASVGAGPVVHRLAPHRLEREAAQGWISRTSRSSLVSGVGKAEHWATALARTGRKSVFNGLCQSLWKD